MKYKVITTNQCKVLVDEEIICNTGELYLSSIKQDVKPKSKGVIQAGDKIIATINHSISLDVPMITVEDNYNMEKDWGNLAILKMVCESNGIGNAYYKEKARLELKYSTQQKGISLDFLTKQLEAFKHDLRESTSDYVKLTCEGAIIAVNKLIELLKQEYMEVEMEQVNNKSGSSYSTETIYKPKTTRNESGQLIAYEKLTA